MLRAQKQETTKQHHNVEASRSPFGSGGNTAGETQRVPDSSVQLPQPGWGWGILLGCPAQALMFTAGHGGFHGVGMSGNSHRG